MATPIKMFKDNEEKIATLNIVDGQLIFAIDSKSIYLDDKNERKSFSKEGTNSYVNENEPIASNNDIWFVIEKEIPEGYASFAEATDAQIAKMISDHYNGICNISDFWHIGDTRTIHMNATSVKSYKEQAYEDQELTIEIIGFDHDDLVNPINGKTKAAITVDCKTSIAGTYERYWGKTYTAVQDTDTWDNNPMRQWFNEDFIAALPEDISSSIKTVKKKNMKLHSSTDGAPIITQDKAFLLSESELVSASEYSSAYKGNTEAEGEQYEFYKTQSNRIKNNDKYWLRSPAFGARNAYNWCGVFNDGNVYDYAGGANSGLAPAFCL